MGLYSAESFATSRALDPGEKPAFFLTCAPSSSPPLPLPLPLFDERPAVEHGPEDPKGRRRQEQVHEQLEAQVQQEAYREN